MTCKKMAQMYLEIPTAQGSISEGCCFPLMLPPLLLYLQLDTPAPFSIAQAAVAAFQEASTQVIVLTPRQPVSLLL